MLQRMIARVAQISLITSCLSAAAVAEDWTQFRGPNATGISTSKNLPVEFSYEKNVKWSAELGRGIACPVIAAGRVFTTTTVEKKTFAVVAFDATSGKQLWRKEFPLGDLPEITSPNEHASCTPATDGKGVYVYFSTLGLLGLNAKNGELLWQHKIPMPRYLLGWGPA